MSKLYTPWEPEIPAGSQYLAPPVGYVGKTKFIKINEFKFSLTKRGKLPWLINDINFRLREKLPVIMAVTGDQSSGKSYFVLDLAEIYDKKFDVFKQIAMNRKRLLYLLSDAAGLKPGQIIMCDEAQFSVSSRSWYDKLQQDIVNIVESIRSKRLVLVFVALHISRFDNAIRDGVFSHHVHMEGRGEAVPYTRHRHRLTNDVYPRRHNKLLTDLPDYADCKSPTCLSCRHSGVTRSVWKRRDRWTEKDEICQTNRAKYERLKKLQVESQINAAIAKQDYGKKLDRSRKMTNEIAFATIDRLIEAHQEKRNNRGRLSEDQLSAVLGVSIYTARSYRAKYERKHPGINEAGKDG